MSTESPGDIAVSALHRVTSAMPDAEERQGQIDMVHAVADAISRRRHIVVQAGTGTGKSLGYLVPALMSGKKTVVATATKALQDQLDNNDLPMLAEHLGLDFEWAVVKGRSNYVCVQRVNEVRNSTDTELDLVDATAQVRREVDAIVEWSQQTATGDLEELPRAPSDRARRLISVGVDECPGKRKCPSGAQCFAEAARDRADAADVIVVNLHLYGINVASGGAILPDHEVVVFDEVHQLESVISDTSGAQLSSGRIASFASAVRAVLADTGLTAKLEESAHTFGTAIAPLSGQRLTSPLPEPIANALVTARLEVNSLLASLREVKNDNSDVEQKIARANSQGTRLAESIDVVLGTLTGYVAFVDGNEMHSQLRISPLHVGDVLNANVWDEKTAILTSATVPISLPQRVGLPPEGTEELVVTSPFDYAKNSRLYCSPEFPDRNSEKYPAFVHDELEALITAAGGRTLALFTSLGAMRQAADALRSRVQFPIFVQGDHSRARLIEMFIADEQACIFASSSFFQGIDLPGRTLSLVVLDKLPFPRPDNPLLQARREAVGRERAFAEIDLPLCATALAQAAGRLIRNATDRGVVAVLDRRLATQSYWRTLIAAMPPMPRTRSRDEIEDFLATITR